MHTSNISNRILFFFMIALIPSLKFYSQYNFLTKMVFILLTAACLVKLPKKIQLNKDIKIFLVLFFLLAIVSLFSLFVPIDSKDAIFNYIYYFITSFSIIFLTIIDDDYLNTFNKLSWLLLVIGTFLSIYGLILTYFGNTYWFGEGWRQYLTIGPFRFEQDTFPKNNLKIGMSLTDNPNTLGLLLMLTQLSSIHLFKIYKESKKYIRPIVIVCIILQFFQLYLTKSRGAILGTIIAVLLYVIFTQKIIKNPILIAVFITIMGLLLMLFLPYIDSIEFGSFFNGRFIAWNYLFSLFKEHPIFGVGYSVSRTLLRQNIGLWHGHNVFISILAQIGLIGLSLFIILWIKAIIVSYKKYKILVKGNNGKRWYFLIFFLVLIILIFHQSVEENLFSMNFVSLYWLYIMVLTNKKIILEN